MDEDLQWVVEEIENECGVAPAIVDDDDAMVAVFQGQQQSPADSNHAQKTQKKRQRLEKMKDASKRRRQEKFKGHSQMHGVELLSVKEQAQAFRSLLDHQSDLERVQAGDFVEVKLGAKRDLTQLSGVIKGVQPAWKDRLLGQHPGAGGPVLLVLTYSATRAVQIIKALREFQTPELHIAKLFAKHLKITEQIAALEGDVRIAVGTPNRVLKLFDAGALSSTHLEHIVVDMGLDAKNFNLFDIHAVRDDFLALFDKYLASQLLSRSGRLRICLY